ncbi:MAG TPA: GlsB/YeaQ/YmgE family stress response membrane protein [Candidatus Limnocylindrales bacterium]
MEIGGIISAILVGIVVGALGRLVLPGRQNISIILTIVVGIIAALVGTALANALDIGDTPGVDWIEVVLQVVVAAVGVGLVAMFTSRRTRIP